MKNITWTLLLILIFISAGIMSSFSQSTALRSKPIGNEKRIQDWIDARLGMFIHRGPVTLKGTEIDWSHGAMMSVEEQNSLT